MAQCIEKKNETYYKNIVKKYKKKFDYGIEEIAVFWRKYN